MRDLRGSCGGSRAVNFDIRLGAFPPRALRFVVAARREKQPEDSRNRPSNGNVFLRRDGRGGPRLGVRRGFSLQ